MDQVLEQLPKARQQARQRILKGQLVPNEEKILSLYEADVHVIVRKKAGAEVEFGNTLFLAENPQGLIIDWELFRGERSRPTPPCCRAPWGACRRPTRRVPKPWRATGGSIANSTASACNEEKIFNAVCPRSPGQLRQRNRSWKFKRMQRRRAQTEGRIGIVKNVFLGGRMRCKGFEHRDLTVTWTVLVHNLWVLARLAASGDGRGPALGGLKAARRVLQTKGRGRGLYRNDQSRPKMRQRQEGHPHLLIMKYPRINNNHAGAKTRSFGTGSIYDAGDWKCAWTISDHPADANPPWPHTPDSPTRHSTRV